MAWLVLNIPFIVLGTAIAVLPVLVMTILDHRSGAYAPRRPVAGEPAPVALVAAELAPAELAAARRVAAERDQGPLAA